MPDTPHSGDPECPHAPCGVVPAETRPMDWKLFATTFTAVFLAELGDKTQIATLGFASGTDKGHLTVFAGSALALVACSALAVIAGAALGRVVPMAWLERVGGLLLVVAGVWTLWKSFQNGG